MSTGRIPIRVILVDDHTLVRQGIAQLVEGEPDLEVVGQAGTLAEARHVLRGHPADVVLMDVSLPDGSGLSLIRELRGAGNELGMVVLTMYDDDQTLLSALDVGASALVLKTAPAEHVLDAFRRAVSAPRAFAAEGLADAIRRQRSQPTLTPREQEVLEGLAQGLSVARVAKALHMSESTVKTHIAKVYDKLGVHNRAGAVMEAIRRGLVTTDQS